MTTLLLALELLSADKITGEQTTTIDKALSITNPKDIPFVDTEKVIDYVNMQLLHNSVDPMMRSALERLQMQLRSRQAS